MKAARIIKTKEPLEIKNVNIPKPKSDQVLVKVESAGVCHSDLHLWEGGYAGPQGVFMKVEDRGVKFPLTPGHEVAGTIDEIGESVTGFSKGDKVLVYPWIGEGTCPACRVGEENVCDSPRSLGIYQDGGYSEMVLVPSYKYLVKLRGLDSELFCVTCLLRSHSIYSCQESRVASRSNGCSSRSRRPWADGSAACQGNNKCTNSHCGH